MRYLLDTHALVWYVDQDQMLSAAAHAAITDSESELLLSAATIWEIAIKIGIGKLGLSLPFSQWMQKAIGDLRLSVLPVSIDYAELLTTLPHHHGDPFDRLMIAQAKFENIAVISIDSKFDQYGVQRLW